ncbi:hypothetical protein ACFL14_00430 [Patescibacteria group bacterium]
MFRTFKLLFLCFFVFFIVGLITSCGGPAREDYEIISDPTEACDSGGITITVDPRFWCSPNQRIHFEVLALSGEKDEDPNFEAKIIRSNYDANFWIYEFVPLNWKAGNDYLIRVLDGEKEAGTLRFRYTGKRE